MPDNKPNPSIKTPLILCILFAWLSGAEALCVDDFAKIDPVMRPMTWITSITFLAGSIYAARRVLRIQKGPPQRHA